MNGKIVFSKDKIEGSPLFKGNFSTPRLPNHPMQFEVAITADHQRLLVKLGELPLVEFPSSSIIEESIDTLVKVLGIQSLNATIEKIEDDAKEALKNHSPQGQ